MAAPTAVLVAAATALSPALPARGPSAPSAPRLAAQTLSSSPPSFPRHRVLLLAAPADAAAMDRDRLLATLNDSAETAEWSELDWERVYRSAQHRSVLPGFASVSGFKPADVDVAELERRTGMPMESLSPRDSGTQWYLLGVAFFAAEALIARTLGMDSALLRALPLAAGAFALDQLVLGSRITLAIVLALRPEYGDKLARHEAGHFLLAYLCGLPVTGYFLAGRSLTIGQAGTIFLDVDLSDQLNQGALRESTLARYTTILMGGIAAEAITFGRAEGGFADEQALVALLQSLRPPWPADQVFSLARWSAAQAVELLQEHKAEHDALTAAMRNNAPLGECLACIAHTIEHREDAGITGSK